MRHGEQEWVDSCLEAARATQRAIDGSRASLLLPVGDAREIAWADVMPVERSGFAAFSRAFADTEVME